VNARRLLIAGWALSLVLLLILGAILLRGLLRGDSPVATLLGKTGAESAPRTEEVVLYFATPGAEGLRAERRNLVLPEDPEAAVRMLVEALIDGPRIDLIATIDSQVRLLNVYVVNGLAVLDFSPDLQATHSGGSSAELLTIYSLVDTVTANIHSVQAVQLLVEGEEIETLSGNVDARFPFRHNADWVLPERTS